MSNQTSEFPIYSKRLQAGQGMSYAISIENLSQLVAAIEGANLVVRVYDDTKPANALMHTRVDIVISGEFPEREEG